MNTNNYIREYVLRGIESLKQDPSLPSCPYCGESWSKIEAKLSQTDREELAGYDNVPYSFKDVGIQEKQTTGTRNQNKQYMDKNIPLKIQYLKTKHIGIYKMLTDAGIVMEFESITDDYGNRGLKSTNPQNVEHLSNEQLAVELNKPENEEAKKLFYKR